MHVRILRVDWGSGLPLKNHINIGFSNNTGPDPLKITNSMWGHHRHASADDDSFIVVYDPPSPHQLKKRSPPPPPPPTKLFKSAHGPQVVSQCKVYTQKGWPSLLVVTCIFTLRTCIQDYQLPCLQVYPVEQRKFFFNYRNLKKTP